MKVSVMLENPCFVLLQYKAFAFTEQTIITAHCAGSCNDSHWINCAEATLAAVPCFAQCKTKPAALD
jgi:hypothetical protein